MRLECVVSKQIRAVRVDAAGARQFAGLPEFPCGGRTDVNPATRP
jgi:hypothetical protein